MHVRSVASLIVGVVIGYLIRGASRGRPDAVAGADERERIATGGGPAGGGDDVAANGPSAVSGTGAVSREEDAPAPRDETPIVERASRSEARALAAPDAQVDPRDTASTGLGPALPESRAEPAATPDARSENGVVAVSISGLGGGSRALQRDRGGGLRPVYVAEDTTADASDTTMATSACDRTTTGAVPGAFETCLSTRLGEPVWRGSVAANDPTGVTIPAATTCEYLLVVSGVFSYSSNGRQDALRRWHEPFEQDFEPYCTSCGIDELEALVSFVIDDKPTMPLAECPLSHSYVYRVVPDGGSVHVAINDYSVSFSVPKFDDNSGGLELELYTVDAEHELLARYVDRDQVLGIAIGASHGAQEIGFAPGTTPILMLLTFPDLAQFQTAVTWPTSPDHGYLLEVRGFLTAQRGVETDALFQWPPLTMSAWPITIAGCSYLLVGTDAYAHRSAYELSNCGSQVTIATTLARPAGVMTAELFDK